MTWRRTPHASDWIVIILLTLLVIIGISVIYYLVVTRVIIEQRPTTPGSFGDMFGLLAAIISGLALGGVVLTGWMQFRSLEGDRSERLREHYLALLDRSERSIARISIEIGSQQYVGHSALKRIAGEVINQVDGLGDRALIVEGFDSVYEQYAFPLSLYFKNQNYLLRFIKESDFVDTMKKLDGTDRNLTLNLYKSQLTKEELQLTLYNVLSRYQTQNARDREYVNNVFDHKILTGLHEKNSPHHLPEKHLSIYKQIREEVLGGKENNG
jgi:hypothetical protein